MEKIIYYTHVVAVVFFIIVFLIKSVLFILNKQSAFERVSRIVNIPERFVGAILFLAGIYLLRQLPSIGTLIIVKLCFVLIAIPLSIFAFRKKMKWLLALSFLFFIGIIGLTESNKKRMAAGTLEQLTTSNGKEIYAASCVHCHGADGRRGAMGAADLSSAQLTRDHVAAVVKNGKGIMIGYNSMLSDEQIQAVTEYVLKLKNTGNK